MLRLKVIFYLVIVIGVLCFAYGFFVEPRLLKTRHISVEAEVPQTIKIALISDIHIGGLHMPPERVAKIVEKVNTHKADIILIAGDFVDGHDSRENHTNAFNTRLDEGLETLAGLNAPLGVYAAMGNHDSWYSLSHLQAKLMDMGLSVLINRAENIEAICIVGLADADTGEEDASAFNQCEDGHTILALMHSPDSFKYLRSDTALAMAGHTHGGQINLPLIGRAVTATRAGKPYAYGLKKWNGVPVFVTAGVGTSILPARFRAPPEIVIIQLGP